MSDTLFSLLEESARQWADRPAVLFGESNTSYAGLHDASLRLATSLTRLGAAPGRRVAFCFRKSVEAIIGMFGIIRTGATYVPLDPAWPADRKATICADAGTAIWVGTDPPKDVPAVRSVVAVNPSGSGAIAMSAALADSPASGSPPAPEHGLANILYTSGSTGRPKGVEITTISLLHFSQWVVDHFGLTQADRLANHAPFTFDLSTLDIFAAVRAGAAMVPVPERLKMFPYQIAKFIADQRITTWYSVPSALILMQQRGSLAEHDLSSLRHLIFAGEVMPKPALQALHRELPRPTYTNLYGPTETNVCTHHRVTPHDLSDNGPLPIGRPISDTRIWVVDEDLRQVSDSQSGELLVAGPTVTTGYFNDAELTARRLVPAPDGDGRAYRTGDRVRRGSDGILLFEGRIDRMIKCRGHRVEPGEIETALARHPKIKEAAIVPLPDPVFGSRIKACIAPRSGDRIDEAELIAFCRDKLPSYMLPDVWQFYPALPRTDREKIDLQALMA